MGNNENWLLFIIINDNQSQNIGWTTTREGGLHLTTYTYQGMAD